MTDINCLNEIAYGGDYNPEQWPEEIWLEDAQLMKKAGVNLVSLGIFSWARLEPEEGKYDFSWLDRVIDILYAQDVAIDLATATASPPAWMIRKYPDILPVDRNGQRYSFGSRQHYCPNNIHLKERTNGLVEALAAHYQNHPAIKMWHVNNEYACHVAECFCEDCRADFQAWLKEKYGSIEKLNDSWGTQFWSQTYYNFEEIMLPSNTPTFINPGEQLDYRRFMDDSIFNLYKLEKKILREKTPQVPITTNFMGFFKPLDYFKWAKEVDVVSWDSYPDPAQGEPILQAMANDLMRSLKGGQPFILMEQVTTHVNWREINVPKSPGTMRRWSFSTIGRGGDGIMFFQWRQSAAGAEKFHGAMVPHSGSENSRSYREVKQLGQELKKLKSLSGARTEAKAALLFDWENWWAVEEQSKPHNKLGYVERVAAFYKVFYEKNIPVDFVAPGDDLSKYEVVIAPLLYMLDARAQQAIEAFTERGGTFIASYFSGIVDRADRVYLGGYPGPLRKVLGITIDEFVPQAEGHKEIISFQGTDTECSLWSDSIQLDTAEAVATYSTGWLAGNPAVTENAFGEGHAFYFGTELMPNILSRLLVKLLEAQHIKPPLSTETSLEIMERTHEDGAHFYIINNHHENTETLMLDQSYTDVLTGEKTSGKVKIPAGDTLILTLEK